MRRQVWTLFVVFGLFFLSACEDKEQTDLFNAQLCLDRATADTALSCVQSIESQSSERAYVLRCSANFLSKGIDEDKIVAAIEEISKDEQSANATSSAIANLAMPNSVSSPTGYDISFAQETLSLCTSTGADALIALATFSVLATTTSSLISGVIPGCSIPYSVQCVETGLDGLDGTQDSATVGQVAVQNQEVLCGENGLFKGEDVCTDIDNAINTGGSNDAIGDAILNGISNDNNS